ncbi:MAG: cytidine deaminase [Bacillota bacterium]|nr:cytidine deaminase [Bacillota bacterium]
MDFTNNRDASAAELYDIAAKALENAYAPFSGFRVGSALLDADGRIFTGVNIENSSFGATICAERTAFVKALSEGSREFTAIAIAAENEEALPCGICRQFMYEFSPDILVITGKDRETLAARRLSELLPLGFRL